MAKFKEKFSALDAFDIAEGIEVKGREFYRKAGRLYDIPSVRKMFFKLADWEEQHRLKFGACKRKLAQIDADFGTLELDSDKASEAHEYAQKLLANLDNPAKELTAGINIRKILEIAIQKEEQSRDFYEKLLACVPKEKGQIVVEAIIQEEKNHIDILRQALFAKVTG